MDNNRDRHPVAEASMPTLDIDVTGMEFSLVVKTPYAPLAAATTPAP